uniref:Mitochondrial transcription termination factor family protein n=1 Tax=Rhizophora mucronata TaxID=61149 RepID=A0A2P2NGX0_RHIMU
MLVSLFNRGRLLVNKREAVLGSSKTQLLVHGYCTSNETKISTEEDSFTVNYLVHSCGLSLESAKSVSHKVQLKFPERADSFLNLLKKYGFNNAQISKIVRSHPLLLVSDAEKTVLPKLEFLRSTGLMHSDLTKFISIQTSVLFRSLEGAIIPNYNFLRSVLLRHDLVVKAMMRSRLFEQDVQRITAPNISLLRGIGVPQASIVRLLKVYPSVLCSSIEKLEKKVKKAVDMGFSPKEMKFLPALWAFSLKESTWQRKSEAYKMWGLSEDDVLLAFKKEPLCMLLSEKKITDGMEFFVNQMNLRPLVIAECPNMLFFSLNKTIVPRCSVIKILQSKGLIKNDISLYYVFRMVEKQFIDNYVIKHQKCLPQLLDVFQGKVSLHDPGFNSKDVQGLKC